MTAERREAPPAAYDVIAPFYDDDMGRNVGGDDIAFYRAQCRGLQGPVLELGCGTGRISLPLVRAGCTVVGIDSSIPMLQVLRRKAALLTAAERARLRLAAMDMRDLPLRSRFAAVLCPYSAFTYLLHAADRRGMLARVRDLLAPDGAFVLDVFVPNPAVENAPRGPRIFDYQRPLADGTVLERSKALSDDDAEGCRTITRWYRFLAADGRTLREITTVEHCHPWAPEPLAAELAAAGFDVLEEFGDFRPGRRPGAQMVALRCAVGRT